MGTVVKFRPAFPQAGWFPGYVAEWLRRVRNGKSRVGSISPVGKLLATREQRQALAKRFRKNA